MNQVTQCINFNLTTDISQNLASVFFRAFFSEKSEKFASDMIPSGVNTHDHLWEMRNDNEPTFKAMFAYNLLRAPQLLVAVLDRVEDSEVVFYRERVCLVGHKTPEPRSGIRYKGIPVPQVTGEHLVQAVQNHQVPVLSGGKTRTHGTREAR